MIEKIKKLQKCKELSDEVKKILTEESTPMVTDVSLLDTLYALYKEHTETETSITRKAFLFVVLFLYCPKVLARIQRMDNGFRSKLAMVMNCHPTILSHNYSEALFLYEHYRCFRKTADELQELFTNFLNTLKK